MTHSPQLNEMGLYLKMGSGPGLRKRLTFPLGASHPYPYLRLLPPPSCREALTPHGPRPQPQPPAWLSAPSRYRLFCLQTLGDDSHCRSVFSLLAVGRGLAEVLPLRCCTKLVMRH